MYVKWLVPLEYVRERDNDPLCAGVAMRAPKPVKDLHYSISTLWLYLILLLLSLLSLLLLFVYSLVFLLFLLFTWRKFCPLKHALLVRFSALSFYLSLSVSLSICFDGLRARISLKSIKGHTALIGAVVRAPIRTISSIE